MAPLPTINDVFRVAIGWTNVDTSRTATNVMHFKGVGLDPADVAGLIDDHVTAAMWEMQDDHSKITTIDVTPLDGSGVTLPVIIAPAAKYAGVQTNEDMVPQMATIVKLVTLKRGRSFRGRIFLPWCTETVSTNGILDSTKLATAQAAWVAFVTAMSGDNCPLGVASYKLAEWNEAAGVLYESHVATQRRRNKRTST